MRKEKRNEIEQLNGNKKETFWNKRKVIGIGLTVTLALLLIFLYVMKTSEPKKGTTEKTIDTEAEKIAVEKKEERRTGEAVKEKIGKYRKNDALTIVENDNREHETIKVFYTAEDKQGTNFMEIENENKSIMTKEEHLEITISNVIKEYDGKKISGKNIEWQISSGNLKKGDKVELEFNKTYNFVEVGNYKIKPSKVKIINKSGTEYKCKLYGGNCTIKPRKVNINVENYVTTYANDVDMKSLTYTDDNNTGMKLEVELYLNKPINGIGTYSIKAKTTNRNFKLNVHNGSLTILPEKIKVIPNNQEYTIGETINTAKFTSSITGKVRTGDDLGLVYHYEHKAKTETGKYKITVEITNANYVRIGNETGVLTIKANPQIPSNSGGNSKPDEDNVTLKPGIPEDGENNDKPGDNSLTPSKPSEGDGDITDGSGQTPGTPEDEVDKPDGSGGTPIQPGIPEDGEDITNGSEGTPIQPSIPEDEGDIPDGSNTTPSQATP